MAYLLDTHTLLWYTQASPQLSGRAAETISNPQASILVGMVSLWEIAIKVNIGKLQLSGDLTRMATEIKHLGFELVGADVETLDTYRNLPLYHRDPFDRLLIAYALTHSHILISADSQFDAYPVKRWW